MPAGSGPLVAAGAANQALGTTSETVVSTVTGNWGANPNALGNLLSAFVTATATGAATLTLRIRQGSGTGGAVVGSAVIYSFAGAATTVPVGTEQYDGSAFANAASAGGQYTLTAQASVSSTITLVNSILEAETVAPLL
jgi:hypothetical protein